MSFPNTRKTKKERMAKKEKTTSPQMEARKQVWTRTESNENETTNNFNDVFRKPKSTAKVIHQT